MAARDSTRRTIGNSVAVRVGKSGFSEERRTRASPRSSDRRIYETRGEVFMKSSRTL